MRTQSKLRSAILRAAALTLSTIVSLLGSRFNEKVLNVINKICGAVIIFYGLKLLYSFARMMGWL